LDKGWVLTLSVRNESIRYGKIRLECVKNAKLRQERQVFFEKLVQSVKSGGLIADQEDFARPGQRRLAIFYDSYAWVVPYVAEQDGTKFLKMAYPSRKLFKEADEEKGWVDSRLHTPEEWK
jgi:hypothetical protein